MGDVTVGDTRRVLDVIIMGTGHYLPETVLPNAPLVARLAEIHPDTTEEWIFTRTGIRERHVVAPGEYTSDMAVKAAKKCLKTAGVNVQDVGLIIVCTVSGDTTFPATACWVQKKLGNIGALCFDVNAGCSGFIVGLMNATALLRSGMFKRALVIGAETMSAMYDPNDRTTYPLAGDGAGCVLLEGVEPSANPHRRGIKEFYARGDGRMADILLRPLGGTRQPLTAEHIINHDPGCFLSMQGKEVYVNAVPRLTEAALGVLELAKVSPSDVDRFVPHQANGRILEAVTERLETVIGRPGALAGRVYSNIDRCANTTSASIPICLDELAEAGELVPGSKIVLFTFGTGFTWGACYLEWGRSWG